MNRFKNLSGKWFAVFLLLSGFVSPAFTQSEDGESASGGTAALSKMVRGGAEYRGQQIYQSACATCHGWGGDGKGPAASSLNPLPRNFTKGLYKFRTTAAGELPTDQDLFYIISNGVARSVMPPYKDLLSKQQIWDLVAYIKSFSEDFAEYGAPEPIEIPELPESTPEFVADGKHLYMALDCWTCHGVNGKGDGPSASTLKDDEGNRVPPMNFTRGHFKRGSSDAEVYKSVMTGLDGTPMPAFGDALLFPGGPLSNEATLAESFTQDEINQLKRYMSMQPKDSEIGSMSDEMKKELTRQRAISLVHYVKSLVKKPSFFYTLFVEDTEVTK